MLNNLLKNLDDLDVKTLLSEMDGSGSIAERKAISDIADVHEGVPKYLCKCYHVSKNARVRAQCMFYLFFYAKSGSKYAVYTGVKGLDDKAKIVRYNACKLLAYAQDKDALPYLEKARSSEKDPDIMLDIKATIDSIENKNHNWFVDRNHSGLITMDVVDRLNMKK